MSHTVHFRAPYRELGRSDVEFVVAKDGKNLGTLKVSRGSLVWFRGKTHKNGLKIGWEEFDELLRQRSAEPRSAIYREAR